MNFEQKLDAVISEIMSVYNLSVEQAKLIRQNIVKRVEMYQNVHPDFNNNETKIVVNGSDIGDFFINRLVTNIRNYDFDQVYNMANTLKGAYTSNDQSLYIGNYKFIKDKTLEKLQNRIPKVDSETLRKATINVFNHELGHALQTSFKGKYGNNDARSMQLISNLTAKYPGVFSLQSTDENLTLRQEGMKVVRSSDKSKDAREFYAKNAYTTHLDEIFNEDEALRVTGVTEPQLTYDMGSGFAKNIYNYQSSNYRITSYGRMMKIIMGEALTFKAMYEDSIVAYEFFDQFKSVSDKIYNGKPPMFNILDSLNKIKNEASLIESQKLDLFLTVCLQKRVAQDLKNPNLSVSDIDRIKNYISEFISQMTRNPQLVTQQDQIISSISNMVTEREKQLRASNLNISNNQSIASLYSKPETVSLEENNPNTVNDNPQQTDANIEQPNDSSSYPEAQTNKDYNYYLNEIIKLVQTYSPNKQLSEKQKKQLIGEIFYNEGYLIESLNNDEEIRQVMTRAVNELSNDEMQIRLQNIILSDLQEKYQKLHAQAKTQEELHEDSEARDDNYPPTNDELDLTPLIGQLKQELINVQKAYHLMMSDGYIDDNELATLIAMSSKILNDGYSLKQMASRPKDIDKINIILSSFEDLQKKMSTMLDDMEEIAKLI